MSDQDFDARRQHPHPSDDRPFHHDDIPEDDLDAFFDVPEVDLPRRPATPPIRPRRIEVEEENQDRWSNEALRGTPSPARQRQSRRQQKQDVTFPASLFGLPYEEYIEKEDWYHNVSWAIFISVFMSSLALLITIL